MTFLRYIKLILNHPNAVISQHLYVLDCGGSYVKVCEFINQDNPSPSPFLKNR